VPVKGGILVEDVMRESPAEEAGLLRGDIILSFDNVKFGDVGDLRNFVAEVAPGRKVKVRLLRDGKEKVLQVKIGELGGPGQARGGKDGGPSALEELGMQAKTMSPEEARQLGYDGLTGVLILSVERGGLAAKSHLRRGDLITGASKQPVKSAKQLRRLMEKAAPVGKILLDVQRGEQGYYVVLKLKK